MGARSGDSAAIRISATASLVFVGCALGAWVDTELRFPGTGAGIVFVPYAILTAALLRSPRRTWWILLIAASAGTFGPHVRAGFSPLFVLVTALINCVRATLAAGGILRFAGRPARFDNLREMAVFLVFAVFLAPAVGASGGALAMRWRGVHDFWTVWEEWTLSSAITALALLPVLMAGAREAGAWPRPSIRRIVETGLLGLGLLAVGAGVFVASSDGVDMHPARLYWPLPFLLWAAVRFGPQGTSAALFAVTALSVRGAMLGRGPFASLAPADSLMELQLFLLAASVPLLLLSALLEEQRRTAADLGESRRQYQSVVEDQTEMICRFRPDGTYTFANGAYCTAFAPPAVDLIGGSVWGLVSAGVHRPREGLLAAITPTSPVATRETEVVTRDGEKRWLQWRDRGLFDGRGTIVEYQSVGRDITDRKRADDERRELEAQRSVEAALREGDRRKDEFLAMLGHELRNPLAPIATALQIMRDVAPHDSRAVRARETIARQLNQLTRLVDDLLDISRVTLGKIRLKLEPVDLARVVTGAVDVTSPLIDSFGHRLIVTLPDAPVRLRGDTVRLTQIVANLLNNAAKYTEPGGRIELSVQREGDTVLLSVRDNGIGFASGALARIFEPFTQILPESERAQGGLGIGLTLVKRLVELHGGTVEARSDGPSLGTEIAVRLPVLERDASTLAPLPLSPTPARRQPSLRILTVDDNVDLADTLAMVLGLWGHTVRTAYDGLAALEVAASFHPDVVLVDLGLPKMDGLEVARRLREATTGAPLLLSMSGFGPELARRRGNEVGFHDHLVKPLDMESLRSLLDACIDGAEGRDGRSAP
jgi:PAS domain S-box-containing protein